MTINISLQSKLRPVNLAMQYSTINLSNHSPSALLILFINMLTTYLISPPLSTPAQCENRTQFESLNLHRIFGCRQFRNQKHITAETNASLVNLGLLPSNIGSFATIYNPPKGKPIKKRRQFLDKLHMEIVFGECVSLEGNRYVLLIVDVATRYYWLYGM